VNVVDKEIAHWENLTKRDKESSFDAYGSNKEGQYALITQNIRYNALKRVPGFDSVHPSGMGDL
jgi:hypothetical protein